MKNPYKKIFLKVQKDIKKAETNFGSIVYPTVSKEIPQIVRERLYTKGTYGDGKKLRTDKATRYNYANSTIFERKPGGRFRGKIQRGARYKNVTLNNLGHFYKSIYVKKEKNGILVKANFMKSKTLGGGTQHIYRNFKKQHNSESDFEKSVLSLHPIQKKKLAVEKINPAIIRYLRGL